MDKDSTSGAPLISELVEKLDRNILGDMTTQTLVKGSCFGREFALNEERRSQIALVAEILEEDIEGIKSSPEILPKWQRLETLVEEGERKGVLLSFVFPPAWLKDSGSYTSEVKKIRMNNDTPGIEVPPQIYSLFFWDFIRKSLKQYSSLSDSALNGRNTKGLGENLRHAYNYFIQRGFINQREDKTTG